MLFVDTVDEMPDSIYVGKTTQHINKRYRQHLNSVMSSARGKSKWTDKDKWIYNVIHSGKDLRIIALFKTNKHSGYKIEKEWIDYFRGFGFNVINKNNDKYITNRIVEL